MLQYSDEGNYTCIFGGYESDVVTVKVLTGTKGTCIFGFGFLNF